MHLALHRCNKRLQRLQKIINMFVLVNVYYFNKHHTKCRKSFVEQLELKKTYSKKESILLVTYYI